MKKLVMLALVCGLASLATAGWSFNVAPTNDSATVLGDYLNIDNYYVVASDADLVVALGSGAPDASGLVVADAKNNGVSGIADGFNGDVYSIASYAGIANRIGAPMFELSGLIAGQTVKVYLVDGGSFAAEELASVTIIPEPATMALLGLGALVLRRKK